ncbi:MAG: plastocyanin/azurin family copper-binding protein [Jatrophihabitantaceae bacterium]
MLYSVRLVNTVVTPTAHCHGGTHMVFPKILIGVSLLVGGIYLPSFAAASVHPRPSGAIGMTHEGFTTKVITVHPGQTITFANDSRFIHIIGVGSDAHLADPGKEPVSPRVLLERNQTYTTGTWNTPGTYHMTCSVHPEMNLEVIVEK